jgi:hypothetical protein
MRSPPPAPPRQAAGLTAPGGDDSPGTARPRRAERHPADAGPASLLPCGRRRQPRSGSLWRRRPDRRRQGRSSRARRTHARPTRPAARRRFRQCGPACPAGFRRKPGSTPRTGLPGRPGPPARAPEGSPGPGPFPRCRLPPRTRRRRTERRPSARRRRSARRLAQACRRNRRRYIRRRHTGLPGNRRRGSRRWRSRRRRASQQDPRLPAVRCPPLAARAAQGGLEDAPARQVPGRRPHHPGSACGERIAVRACGSVLGRFPGRAIDRAVGPGCRAGLSGRALRLAGYSTGLSGWLSGWVTRLAGCPAPAPLRLSGQPPECAGLWRPTARGSERSGSL